MAGRREPGASIGVHPHEDDAEGIYRPKGRAHGLENNGDEDLAFFAVIFKQ